MAKRLGKGLDAIIPDLSKDIESEYRIAEIEIDNIRVNPLQPRKEFNDERMEELRKSVKEKGIIQPITVRAIGDSYELIAGERRLRAARDVGLKTIPAYIIPVDTDVELVELALIENLQREDLNPIEEANAYHVLANAFNLSHEEIARRVGKDRSTITNSLRLLNLPEQIKNDLRNGVLTQGHARAILSINDEKTQIKIWERIKKANLSVRKVEGIVRKYEKKEQLKREQKEELSPFVKDIEQKLRHFFGTKVKINGNESKGKIEIEYYSSEDLNRVLELIENKGE